MALGFHHIGYSEEKCGICLEHMDDVQDVELKGGIVIHGGEDGEKHPFHKECIKVALVMSSRCPTCRVELNGDAITTWQEKSVVKLNYVINKTFELTLICTVFTVGLVILLGLKLPSLRSRFPH